MRNSRERKSAHFFSSAKFSEVSILCIFTLWLIARSLSAPFKPEPSKQSERRHPRVLKNKHLWYLVARIARPASLAIWHRKRSHCKPHRNESPNRRHFWKGAEGIPTKGTRKTLLKVRVFSRYFQGVSGCFQGCFQGVFRVFSVCFSVCPFRVCPLDPLKFRIPQYENARRYFSSQANIAALVLPAQSPVVETPN